MLSDKELSETIVFEIALSPTVKIRAMADGLVEGLPEVLDALQGGNLPVTAVVTNYIPDLLRQRAPRIPGHHRLGFDIQKCEGGAWVISDYDLNRDEVLRFACVDDDAMYTQMRAWTERQIEGHRKFRQAKARTDSGPHLSAARDLSV